MPVSVSVDGVAWHWVRDLTTARSDESVFAVDADTGIVRFGDGTHGQRPPSGATINVTFLHGSGAGGNVPVNVSAASADLRALERPRYFPGRLLTADDFQAEQDYLRARQRRHNEQLHGSGIVSGLDVTVGEDGIMLFPGMALDTLGNDIVIGAPQLLPFPGDCRSVWLVVSYAEKLTETVPSAAGATGDDMTAASRTQESFAWRYALAGESHPNEVPLARLLCIARRWRVFPRRHSTHRTPFGMLYLGVALLAFAGAAVWVPRPRT
jgi:hypothetical protein